MAHAFLMFRLSGFGPFIVPGKIWVAGRSCNRSKSDVGQLYKNRNSLQLTENSTNLKSMFVQCKRYCHVFYFLKMQKGKSVTDIYTTLPGSKSCSITKNNIRR